MAFETDLIRRYSGAFTKENCEKIIEGIKFFEDNHLLFYDKGRLTREDHKTINITHDYNFSASSRLADEILPKFKPCVDEYLQAFQVLGQRKFLLHDIKLKQIPAGGGFHAWHYETGALEVAARQFVVQLYLNDDFDGGETEFLYQQRREEAVAGDVIIFPASFTHTHRGNPPLGGTKYIATSWGIIQHEDNL
tara:strand:+ start:133 stop:711 length:579 start_codon:yes stop_codon:yes gene_type:complete